MIEESGLRHELIVQPDDAPLTDRRVVDGEERVLLSVVLPLDLPPGYHSLRLAETFDGSTQIIVAPQQAYLPPVLAEGACLGLGSSALYPATSGQLGRR
ncbi:hypothetical protein HQ394_07810 [Defluviicoccus vanus]|uniref:MalQ N-terminal beta-sandwich domain-containing protein n=1 Tax=Defluviicoccus vanus TaxID=111831 RepID=A0A7H1N0L5_9PROT|nr:hypothetical protein [Defluviicoccus vanus]QNT69251.1 hypothetical protein HQ394_07810 [Defluviicoccus vanus]